MTQDGFIEKLFDDLMFGPSQKRAWLETEYGVKYADGLSTVKKSALIDRLKNMKEESATFKSRFKQESEED